MPHEMLVGKMERNLFLIDQVEDVNVAISKTHILNASQNTEQFKIRT